jgi:Uma2 family endonuclease
MDFENQVTHQETAEPQEPRSAAEIQYELERNKPMPSLNHARIQASLVWLLTTAYRKEYDILSELTIDFPVKPAVPDVCIYPVTPADWQNDVIKRVDIPLLAIEILSPRQIFDDIIDKIQKIYFPAGMSSVWVVLPSVQSVMIFTPNAKPQMFTSGIMHDAASGFEVDLDKIF